MLYVFIWKEVELVIYDWQCSWCDSYVYSDLQDSAKKFTISCPNCKKVYKAAISKERAAKLVIIEDNSDSVPNESIFCKTCRFYHYYDTIAPVSEIDALQEVGYCALESEDSLDYYYRTICNKVEAYTYQCTANVITFELTDPFYIFRILCTDFKQVDKIVKDILSVWKSAKISYMIGSNLTASVPSDLEKYPLRLTIKRENDKASLFLEYGVFKLDEHTIYAYNYFYIRDTSSDDISPF